MKEQDFQQFLIFLMKAIQKINSHYIQLPVAKKDELELIYRERVYCYELYHQLRLLLGDDFPYKLHGEVDKSGHPIIRNDKKPDFIVHNPGTMSNLVVIEVKPVTVKDKIRKLREDIDKLKMFITSKVNYYRAIMLIYGSINGDLPQNIKQEIESIQNKKIITLWHYKINKKPKIIGGERYIDDGEQML
jgi:hypothetical protein